MASDTQDTQHAQTTIDDVRHDPYVLTKEKIQEPPTGLKQSLKFLGPGMITSAAVVGSGELITATTLGSRVGMMLLWLIFVSTFVKVFIQVELARWSISTGKPAIFGYDEVKPTIAGHGWPSYIVLIMFFQFVTGQAGVIGAAGVTTRTAAAAEPLGVAIHGIRRAESVTGPIAGQTILVNGCGPIGAFLIGAAKHFGAAEVYACDLADLSLGHARDMGADHLINPTRDELPHDVPLVFDCSGAPAAIDGLLRATRRGGTLVQVGNLPGQPAPIGLGQLVTREITYIGSYRFIDEVTDALEAMASGLDVEPLLTHEFPIGEAPAAFATAADRSTGSSKVLLKLS